MPDSTDRSTPPAGLTGWCHWHKGPSGTARLVDVVDQSSGPGRPRYACAPCRDQHRLAAMDGEPDTIAYRVYIEHLWDCDPCSALTRCTEGQRLWDAYQTALHTTAAVS